MRCSEERTGKKKTRMFCCDVEKKQNTKKQNIHFKTYQYLIYFSGNNFILCPDFVTSGEKEIKKKKKKILKFE